MAASVSATARPLLAACREAACRTTSLMERNPTSWRPPSMTGRRRTWFALITRSALSTVSLGRHACTCRAITADTALRLGLFFGMEPRFWLNLQTEYDIRIAARTLQDRIAPRIRVFQRVAA